MNIKDYLEKVLVAYSQGDLYEEVKRAKEEFFDRVGRVAEGSEKFDVAMNAFLDWYLFDRPLDKHDMSPIKMYMMDHAVQLDADEREVFEDFTKSKHSLFELLKVKGTDVFIQDLFDKEKYIVEESEVHAGFTKGDVFEGRLIKFKDKLVFGQSFVFHPSACKDFIRKKSRAIKYLDDKQRLRLIHQLAMMKQKVEQYPHIDVKYIYTETPLF